MHASNWKGLLALLPLALLTVLLAVAHAQQPTQTGDPVADAARKARAQKKEEPKPKKIYTDDDVKPAEPAPAPAQAPSESQAKEGSQQAGAAATGKEDPNGEKAWRKRFADQRTKIAKAEEELNVMQRELEKDQVQYYPDPQKAMNQQLTRNNINEKTAKIAAKKQEIEKLNQELSSMEDQLRKSGGDPGWARP